MPQRNRRNFEARLRRIAETNAQARARPRLLGVGHHPWRALRDVLRPLGLLALAVIALKTVLILQFGIEGYQMQLAPLSQRGALGELALRLAGPDAASAGLAHWITETVNAIPHF